MKPALALLAATVLLIAGCGGTSSSAPSGPSLWHLVYDADPLSSFSFHNASLGWGVFQQGTVVQTHDGGRDWNKCTGRIVGVPTSGVGALPATVDRLPLPVQVLSVGRSVFLTYYARAPGTLEQPSGATSSGVLVSSDEGATWHRCLSLAPSRDSVLYLAASDPRHLWALCAPGRPDQPGPTYLLRSANAGANWSRLPGARIGMPGMPGFGGPFTFVGARHGWSWFVPYSGAAQEEVRTTADGGESWTKVAQPKGSGLGTFALDALHAWTAGSVLAPQGGALNATADGGESWWRDPRFAHLPLSAVYFADAQHGWVVFADVHHGGGVYGTSDGGRHWRRELAASGDWWSAGGWTFEKAGDTLFLGSAEGGGLYARTVTAGQK
jgi:photosystem II stability/assembly factor-like uncharacterized protein